MKIKEKYTVSRSETSYEAFELANEAKKFALKLAKETGAIQSIVNHKTDDQMKTVWRTDTKKWGNS